jgi:Tfp pilus assembly protein PilF
LVNAKNAAAAQASLQTAVGLDPKLDKSYLFRGLIHAASGRNETARQDFEMALKCNPDCEHAERELRKLAKLKR